MQVVKELVAIFPVLRDWIAEFLLDNNNMVASEVGHNMLIEQVLWCGATSELMCSGMLTYLSV